MKRIVWTGKEYRVVRQGNNFALETLQGVLVNVFLAPMDAIDEAEAKERGKSD